MRRLQLWVAWLVIIAGLLPVVALAAAWATVEIYGCATVTVEGCPLFGTPLGYVVVGMVLVAGLYVWSLPVAALGALWLYLLRKKPDA